MMCTMSSLPALLLALGVITTGLYAGFLLTFLTAVMPGIAALPDERFAAAMRRFNEKVPGRRSDGRSDQASAGIRGGRTATVQGERNPRATPLV